MSCRSGSRHALCVFAAMVLSLAMFGCVSASKLLDRAEASWSAGQYSQAIEHALSSYERAVEKNKEPGEIQAAQSFLQERFPLANDYLVERAENRLAGSDAEKAEAWKVFQTLVDMNRRVRDSIASSFLDVRDFHKELQEAKETAAQIKYVKALELMGNDRRASYIEAYGLFAEIDGFVPDYRDIRSLAETCRELGTLVVAFSDRSLPFTVRDGDIEGYQGFAADGYAAIREYIETNDHPDFLTFVTAGSVQGAKDAGAVLFAEIQGDLWASSDTDDEYGSAGTITWERSYGGTPTLLVTRIADGRTDVAAAGLSLEQDVTIEFFPQKYDTVSLTPEMYTGQFNNSGWMASQLSSARRALDDTDGRASMVVWAEMQYGGIASFLTTAEVTGTEGVQVLPIEDSVWRDSAVFINQTLPSFLGFRDIDLTERMAEEMTAAFLSSPGVRELLANIEG